MSTRRAWQGIAALLVAICVWRLAGDAVVPRPPDGNGPAPSPIAVTTGGLPANRTERAAYGAPPVEVPYATIALRILLADGRPAVGAEVRVGSVHTIDPEQDETWSRFPTGAEATAFLPWSHASLGMVPIVARHGAQWGRIVLPASTRAGTQHTIQLQPDQTVVVRAVDGNDQPVAQVLVTLVGPPAGLEAKAVHQVASAWTTATGEATFLHAQQWIPDIAPRDGKRPLQVRTGALASAPPLHLDADHLPRAPVTVRVDAFGHIDVLAMESDGTPIANGAAVGLLDDGDRMAFAVVNDGHATFPVVSLGASFRASLIFQHRDPVEFAGPGRAGEVVTVTLYADACPVLAGQVWRDGAPLPSTRLRIQSDKSGLFTTATSGADGRFRCRLRTLHPTDRTFTVDALDDADAPTGWRVECTGPLAAEGEQDLGVLTLLHTEVLPLLATGRIVTSAPLERVSLQVTANEPSHGRTRHGTSRGAELPFDPPETTVRADGSFEVRGSTAVDAMAICAAAVRHGSTDWIPFRRGQRDLVLTLEPEHVITARFVVPSRAVAMALQPVLKTADDDDWYLLQPDDRSFDGSLLTCRWWFGFEDTAELQVSGFRDGPPLRSIPGVAIGKGARPDPRLDRIELQLPRLLRVTVPAPPTGEGMGWSPGVEVLRDDEAIGRATELDEHTWLLLADAPVDLRVTVPGFRARILRAVHTDIDVALAPPIVVVFECTLRDLPGFVGGSLQLAGPTYLDASLREGVVRAHLSAPGRYELSVQDDHNGIDLVCEPRVIEVGENGGGYQVLVRPK